MATTMVAVMGRIRRSPAIVARYTVENIRLSPEFGGKGHGLIIYLIVAAEKRRKSEKLDFFVT